MRFLSFCSRPNSLMNKESSSRLVLLLLASTLFAWFIIAELLVLPNCFMSSDLFSLVMLNCVNCLRRFLRFPLLDSSSISSFMRLASVFRVLRFATLLSRAFIIRALYLLVRPISFTYASSSSLILVRFSLALCTDKSTAAFLRDSKSV